MDTQIKLQIIHPMGQNILNGNLKLFVDSEILGGKCSGCQLIIHSIELANPPPWYNFEILHTQGIGMQRN
jgi:hypothetical protein